jgi:hypothetical protein
MALLLPSLALGAGPAVADPNLPPPFGWINTGSSAPPGTNGTGSSGAPLGTGSSRPLRLGPAASRTVSPEAPLRLGPAEREPAAPSAVPAAQGGTLGNALGLGTGSTQTACAGSAVVGGAGLLLGLLTGSGLPLPGVLSLGSSGSSLTILGSSGSGLGSAAVGSAATGSALLTCLLLLPAPAAPPELPLRIPALPPLPQIVPVQVRVPAPVRAPARPAPEIVRPRPRSVPPAMPVAQATPPVAWNLLELITVMVVSVIASVRLKPARRGSRGGA